MEQELSNNILENNELGVPDENARDAFADEEQGKEPGKSRDTKKNSEAEKEVNNHLEESIKVEECYDCVAGTVSKNSKINSQHKSSAIDDTKTEEKLNDAERKMKLKRSINTMRNKELGVSDENVEDAFADEEQETEQEKSSNTKKNSAEVNEVTDDSKESEEKEECHDSNACAVSENVGINSQQKSSANDETETEDKLKDEKRKMELEQSINTMENNELGVRDENAEDAFADKEQGREPEKSSDTKKNSEAEKKVNNDIEKSNEVEECHDSNAGLESEGVEINSQHKSSAIDDTDTEDKLNDEKRKLELEQSINTMENNELSVPDENMEDTFADEEQVKEPEKSSNTKKNSAEVNEVTDDSKESEEKEECHDSNACTVSENVGINSQQKSSANDETETEDKLKDEKRRMELEQSINTMENSEFNVPDENADDAFADEEEGKEPEKSSNTKKNSEEVNEVTDDFKDFNKVEECYDCVAGSVSGDVEFNSQHKSSEIDDSETEDKLNDGKRKMELEQSINTMENNELSVPGENAEDANTYEEQETEPEESSNTKKNSGAEKKVNNDLEESNKVEEFHDSNAGTVSEDEEINSQHSSSAIDDTETEDELNDEMRKMELEQSINTMESDELGVPDENAKDASADEEETEPEKSSNTKKNSAEVNEVTNDSKESDENDECHNSIAGTVSEDVENNSQYEFSANDDAETEDKLTDGKRKMELEQSINTMENNELGVRDENAEDAFADKEQGREPGKSSNTKKNSEAEKKVNNDIEKSNEVEECHDSNSGLESEGVEINSQHKSSAIDDTDTEDKLNDEKRKLELEQSIKTVENNELSVPDENMEDTFADKEQVKEPEKSSNTKKNSAEVNEVTEDSKESEEKEECHDSNACTVSENVGINSQQKSSANDETETEDKLKDEKRKMELEQSINTMENNELNVPDENADDAFADEEEGKEPEKSSNTKKNSEEVNEVTDDFKDFNKVEECYDCVAGSVSGDVEFNSQHKSSEINDSETEDKLTDGKRKMELEQSINTMENNELGVRDENAEDAFADKEQGREPGKSSNTKKNSEAEKKVNNDIEKSNEVEECHDSNSGLESEGVEINSQHKSSAIDDTDTEDKLNDEKRKLELEQSINTVENNELSVPDENMEDTFADKEQVKEPEKSSNTKKNSAEVNEVTEDSKESEEKEECHDSNACTVSENVGINSQQKSSANDETETEDKLKDEKRKMELEQSINTMENNELNVPDENADDAFADEEEGKEPEKSSNTKKNSEEVNEVTDDFKDFNKVEECYDCVAGSVSGDVEFNSQHKSSEIDDSETEDKLNDGKRKMELEQSIITMENNELSVPGENAEDANTYEEQETEPEESCNTKKNSGAEKKVINDLEESNEVEEFHDSNAGTVSEDKEINSQHSSSAIDDTETEDELNDEMRKMDLEQSINTMESDKLGVPDENAKDASADEEETEPKKSSNTKKNSAEVNEVTDDSKESDENDECHNSIAGTVSEDVENNSQYEFSANDDAETEDKLNDEKRKMELEQSINTMENNELGVRDENAEDAFADKEQGREPEKSSDTKKNSEAEKKVNNDIEKSNEVEECHDSNAGLESEGVEINSQHKSSAIDDTDTEDKLNDEKRKLELEQSINTMENNELSVPDENMEDTFADEEQVKEPEKSSNTKKNSAEVNEVTDDSKESEEKEECHDSNACTVSENVGINSQQKSSANDETETEDKLKDEKRKMELEQSINTMENSELNVPDENADDAFADEEEGKEPEKSSNTKKNSEEVNEVTDDFKDFNKVEECYDCVAGSVSGDVEFNSQHKSSEIDDSETEDKLNDGKRKMELEQSINTMENNELSVPGENAKDTVTDEEKGKAPEKSSNSKKNNMVAYDVFGSSAFEELCSVSQGCIVGGVFLGDELNSLYESSVKVIGNNTDIDVEHEKQPEQPRNIEKNIEHVSTMHSGQSQRHIVDTSEQLPQTQKKCLTIKNEIIQNVQEVEVAKARLEEMKHNNDESILKVHRMQQELSYSQKLVAQKAETIDKLQLKLQQKEKTEKLLEDEIRKTEQARLSIIEERDNLVRVFEAERSEAAQLLLAYQALTQQAHERLPKVQRLQKDLSYSEGLVAPKVETIDQLKIVLQQTNEREKQLEEELRKSERALLSANEQRDQLVRALEAERRGVQQRQLASNAHLSQLSGNAQDGEQTANQEALSALTEEHDSKKDLMFPTCSSCNQFKVDLNLFACFHSYCTECLAKSYTRNNDNSSTNSCRECTTRFTDLSRDIGTSIQSPVNKYVSKVFKTTQLSTDQDKNAKVCHACSKLLGHDTTRSNYCAECRQQLCDECVVAHSQLSTTKNHRVVAAGDVLPLIVQTSCSNHAEKAVEWYCDQCKLLMCAKCCIQLHRSHNCLDITEVADDRRSKLLQNANHSSDECNIALAHLEREKRQWIAEFKSVNERISTEASEAAKRLMNAKQILCERLQQMEEHVLRWFDFTMGAMQRKRENLQFIAELRKTVGKLGNPCEVVCFYDAVALPDAYVVNESSTFNLSWPNGVIDAPLPIRPVILKPIELSNFVPSSFDCYSQIMKNGEQLRVDGRYDTMTWEDTRERLDEDARMIAELQSRIVQEVRMAKAKLEEMKQNNDESISKLTRLQQELSYSERLLAQKEETIAEFQSSNRDLQLQIGESKKEAHNNSEKLQQTQQRCVTLENAYRQKAREAEVAKAKMEEMRHTNYEAERSRAAQWQLANQAIMQQAQQLKEAWKSCEAQLSQSKAHEHQLEMRVKKLLSERLPPVAVPVCDDLVEGRARAPAYGITSIDSELYVLRMASSQIEVYSIETFGLQRRLTVKGIVDVADMTSCTRYRCLYVADSKNGIVHRIQVDDAAPSSGNHRWFAVLDKPFGLSVTPKEQDVLVTCKEVNRLKQFKTNGELVRQIVLDESVVHPRHAVQLTTGQLIVCHGERSDTEHRACLMTADGKRVIASFVGNATREDDDSTPLDWPTHVAVDSCHGYVYVADYNNKRVVILNGDMVQIGQVGGSRRTMKSPLRLCLDGDVNRMYVAQCGGHVAVYSIHHPFQSMVLE